MIKKVILIIGLMVSGMAVFAQGIDKCASDDFYREQLARYPDMKIRAQQLDKEIHNSLRGIISNPNAKLTDITDSVCWADDVSEFHIPVVVHVIYDFSAPGNVSISDNEIYAAIDHMNQVYNMNDQSLSGIIPTWAPYKGNPHITFHLANRDPQNNPTRGIVRTFSYLTNGGDESAKLAPWPPDQYLNIYLENVIGRGTSKGIVLAYATFPESYTDNPFSQGVISRTDQAFLNPNFGDVYTISHEVGHFLRLYHPWNSNNQEVEGTVCGDDDVDDTPPTIGHFSCTNPKLYDTMCATGYFKVYDSIDYFKRTCQHVTGGGTINYPDTTNSQNIMDYSACTSEMFTKEQAARMRAALRSNVGFRSNLVSDANLRQTGIFDANGNLLPRPDIAPTALFSEDIPFVCADGSTNVLFTNRSYNDTISSAAWNFGGGATNATPNSTTTVSTAFTTPGWVKVSLTATGNGNSGSNTITVDSAVYAADSAGFDPHGYYEDFNPNGDLNKYPIFNYYNNDHRWSFVNNAGVYDQTSIEYANYDYRGSATIGNATTTTGGSYSDFLHSGL